MSACPNYIPALSVVDSPIEGRLVSTMFGRWEFSHYLELRRKDTVAKCSMLFHTASGPLAVSLQAQVRQLPRRRIDILIEPMAGTLIVEIDGIKYHSDTQSMIRDREKDRDALIAGFQTVRFTGKDIWDNPEKCVNQIRVAAKKLEDEKWAVLRQKLDAEYTKTLTGMK